MEKIYKHYLRNKYEGQMIRLADSIYQTSKFREIRSRDLLKRKLLFTDEFIFIDVEQSTTGRASGTFIGVFETKNKETFRATAKNYTMDESRELYNTISGNLKKYIGMESTIEYQELSNTGVPLRAKFVAFRKDGE
jgi:ATP-dependent DNA ligase